MLVVAALGGNAMLKRGQPPTADAQRANVKLAAKALAAVVRAGHRLIITHGNGPQVGLLALQGAAYKPDEAYPLDVLGAETEGMIGYMIEQELENALNHDRPVATLLTQVIVDAEDPAFRKPTKFVGPVYDKAEAEMRAKAAGWAIAPDGDKMAARRGIAEARRNSRHGGSETSAGPGCNCRLCWRWRYSRCAPRRWQLDRDRGSHRQGCSERASCL